MGGDLYSSDNPILKTSAFQEELAAAFTKVVRRPLDIQGKERKRILNVLTLTGQAQNGDALFSRRYEVSPVDIAYGLDLSHDRLNGDHVPMHEMLGLSEHNNRQVELVFDRLMRRDYSQGINIHDPNEPFPGTRTSPFGMNILEQIEKAAEDKGAFDYDMFVLGGYFFDCYDSSTHRQSAFDNFSKRHSITFPFLPHLGSVEVVHLGNLEQIAQYEPRLRFHNLNRYELDELTEMILTQAGALHRNGHHMSLSEAPALTPQLRMQYILEQEGFGESDARGFLYLGWTYGLEMMGGGVTMDAADTFGKFSPKLTELDSMIGRQIEQHPWFVNDLPVQDLEEHIDAYIVYGSTYAGDGLARPSGSVARLNQVYVPEDEQTTPMRVLKEIVINMDYILRTGDMEWIPNVRLSAMNKDPRMKRFANDAVKSYVYFLENEWIPVTPQTAKFYGMLENGHIAVDTEGYAWP